MDIDLLSAESFAKGQPHEQFRWLRENAPVYRHPEPDGPGYWALTRHEDIREVSRNHAVFSNEPTIMIQDAAAGLDLPDKMMLMCDPPHHTQLRRLVSHAFTPKAARGLAPRIQTIAREILDAVIDRGECDLVADIAGELPSFVIAEMLGLPREDGRMLYGLTETLHSTTEAAGREAQAAAGLEMFSYSAQVVAEKRARPRDDLASLLLHTELDGRRLTDMEFHLFFMLLVDAGGDTTRNLVAGGMLALLERPDQLALLREDLDARLPTAREELLRFTSPVVYMRRTALRDAEISGQSIREGDKVVLYYGSANRDEAAFDRPDQVDVLRSPNRHVAFGATGAHFCLGAQIARVEIDAMLREILTRLEDLELTAEPEWLPSNFISGPRQMPVRFRPAA